MGQVAHPFTLNLTDRSIFLAPSLLTHPQPGKRSTMLSAAIRKISFYGSAPQSPEHAGHPLHAHDPAALGAPLPQPGGADPDPSKGISTGDFEEALAALLGKDAPGLSASTIARLKEVRIDAHEHWSKRDLPKVPAVTRRRPVVGNAIEVTPPLFHAMTRAVKSRTRNLIALFTIASVLCGFAFRLY